MLNRKSSLFAIAIISMVAIFSLSLTKKKKERSRAVTIVAELYKTEIERFDSLMKEYPKYFYDSSYTVRVSKYQDFARQLKKIEGLFFYFHPQLAHETFFKPPVFAKRDFGPPLPDNWLLAGPFGIVSDSEMAVMNKQRIEFSKKFIGRSITNFRKLINECNYMQDCQVMTEQDIFAALRLQMARISTIGLSNADMTVEEPGMAALEGELSGWSDLVKVFLDQLPASMEKLKKQMIYKMAGAQKVLDLKPSFRKFDRLDFLVTYLIPLSEYFNQLQNELKVENKLKFFPFDPNAPHIYSGDIFNADYFAPGEDAYLTNAKAELGKFLFFDPILSDNNERACASCHKPELAFTDGNKKSLNFERGDLPRNAPTVINAAFQKHQFWDLRATSLEDQLDSVINSTDELHSSFERVIDRINSSEEYKQMFYAAFPETKKTGIERKHVKIAIASYERTLTSFNSRFDQYVRGDKTKLNESEIHGFNLFMGQAKCGTCHYAPLFSAPRPPYFEYTDSRSLGVPVKDTMDVFHVDPDTGFSKVTKDPFLHFSFKVPTVRNVELTAPYMHNGVYKTLDQVIDFYNHAGGVKFAKDYGKEMKGLPFFMILPDTLGLNTQDKNDLVLFLRTLTDTTSIKNVPKRLPTITGKHAKLNKRKLGGEY